MRVGRLSVPLALSRAEAPGHRAASRINVVAAMRYLGSCHIEHTVRCMLGRRRGRRRRRSAPCDPLRCCTLLTRLAPCHATQAIPWVTIDDLDDGALTMYRV